jgi:hypothetical protein
VIAAGLSKRFWAFPILQAREISQQSQWPREAKALKNMVSCFFAAPLKNTSWGKSLAQSC